MGVNSLINRRQPPGPKDPISGEIYAKRDSNQGMLSLMPEQYPTVLEHHLDACKISCDIPVVVCGMAGAATGWLEAPYRPISEKLIDLAAYSVRVPSTTRCVSIIPGLKQCVPADVMRGEETQLLGLIAEDPGFTGIVCLPGTHTKWVKLDKGTVKSFTTCMSGELFALLSTQSVLKTSLNSDRWDNNAFENAVLELSKDPGKLATSLFGLRASDLLNGHQPQSAKARLSGLLIGYELMSMKHYWEQGNVRLVGDPSLCKRYQAALFIHKIQSTVENAEALTLKGLTLSFQRIQEHTYGA